MSGHEHHWKPALHLDGCHFYEWRYGCDCGAVKLTWAERDVSADSWSAVWMADEGDGETCARCSELMGGAEPQYREEIHEPKKEPS